MRQAAKVVNVPKTISIGPTEEKMFAMRQPKVKPIVYQGLKNTNKLKSSEKRSCMNSYDNGPHAAVIAAYSAAIIPFKAMVLMMKTRSLFMLDLIQFFPDGFFVEVLSNKHEFN